jgi:hypothetical protein
MAHIDPRPDEQHHPTMSTPGDARRTVTSRSAGSTGIIIAGILLVIGLVLLGMMVLSPARRPNVNTTPATPTTPAPQTTPATPAAPR